MKQVRVHGPDDARLDDVPEPAPGPHDVVVRVAACGVCGTDLKFIAMGGLMGPGPEPLALGHELAGEIDFVGAEVDGVAVGDRVVVNPGNNDVSHIGNGGPEGAFTHRLLVREAAAGGRLLAVPDDLPLDVAALTEPVGVGMHAAERADVGPGDQVVVLGAGPIGLAAVVACLDRGAADVVAVDLSPERLTIAAELGAHATSGPDELWSLGRERHGVAPSALGPMAGADAYIECTGSGAVLAEVVTNAGPGATISVAGLHFDDVPISFLHVMSKELTIRGSMEYPERFDDALDLVARHHVAPMITHRVPLDDWPRVMALIAGPKTFAKIMVTMA